MGIGSHPASILDRVPTGPKRNSFPTRKKERGARRRGDERTTGTRVVGKAASIAIQTWVRNNDKTKARAEE